MTSLRPILDVASEAGLAPEDILLYGPHVAKIALPSLKRLLDTEACGRVVLVSAMSPTRAGEGKTTVSIGLVQALRKRGRQAVLSLRQPSLGPIFGVKGGGTGGGRARLEPSERINLHFTGDFHAVGAAHNLLAALIDNAIHFRGELDLEHRQILWRRVMDMNDRFLRRVVIGLGGREHGVPREDSFDITAASEAMAILCLARDISDLKARLGRLLVGFDRSGEPVTAARLGAAGPMAALLRDALLPNLVQTCEGGPALVHGGPFGNIAHGCSSALATRAGQRLAEFVVTEAGFGFDLGAEKFFDIKCRAAGLWPNAVVLVVTARALRFHGGDKEGRASGSAALAAIARGLGNLDQHIKSAQAFGFDPVVAINVFPHDTEAELTAVEHACTERGLLSARFRGFSEGGDGALDLADRVIEAAARPAQTPRYLYELHDTPEEKICAVTRTIYGARDVEFTREAHRDIERVRRLGYADLPVCIAKTHLSLSDDPSAVGRPREFELVVRNVRIAAGAGYLLVLTGDILTMPGLPAKPQAHAIDLTDDGEIVGLV